MTEPYLAQIPTGKISSNPDNPRLFFRDGELETLLISIKRIGIQVPVTVYKEGNTYTLIDGERRWRCAIKLNLKSVPALIHPKPSPLENLLFMFNIHALREQWDYFTIANKLGDVISLFVKESGHTPNEVELSEATGLTRGQIRRCRLLFELPEKYKQILIEDLSLPKQRQKLSEDLFIEMERSLSTIHNRVPNAIKGMDKARDAIIKKFRSGVIGNITDLRKLSKIATSVERLGIEEEKSLQAIRTILDPNNDVGVVDIFRDQFEFHIDERKMTLSIESLVDYLQATLHSPGKPVLGAEFRRRLKKLKGLIERILGSDQ